MSAVAPAGKPAGKKPKRHQRSDPKSKKRRWTAEERAAKGRKPRRRGGVDKPEDRGPARSRHERSDRKPYERSERTHHEKSERKSYEKSERKSYDKPERKSYDRTVRRPYEKSERKSYDRSERKPYEKSERKSYERNERRPYDKPERKSHERNERTLYRSDQVETVAPVSGGFAELGVAPALADRLAADGIVTPFPIQAASIPDAVSGRDVLGRGRTGSGKTLGFGLPLLTRLTAGRSQHAPRGLILLPTRELATQVSDVLRPLAHAVGLRTLLVAGGMSYGPQLKTLENGVDIIIGTPGRLIDLMDRGALLLNTVEITVLDEADHMADLGFLPDVTTLLDAVPGDGQRMLFSATLDRGIDRLVDTYLHDPSTHQVDSAQASVETMTHYLLPVAPADKRVITAEIAGRNGRTVIFVRTQLGADRVAEQLRASGVMAGPLHGGLPQGARNRTLEAFKTGRLPVLVATDVAARGIHVDEVGLVLQVDPPADSKTYLHRAGRTARAGEAGVVVTLMLPDQRRQVRRLAKDAGVQAVNLDLRPGDAGLAEATGAVPASGQRIDDRDFERLIAPRQSRPGSRSGGRSAGGHRRGRGADRPGNRHDRPRNRGDKPGNRQGKQGGNGRDRARSEQRSGAYDNRR